MPSLPPSGDSLALSPFIEGPLADYPRTASVDALFQKQACRTPDAIACLSGTESVTYRELEAHVDRFSRCLHHRGVASGDRVAVLVEKSIRMVAVLLGILRSGATYVPISPAQPFLRVASILKEARVRLVVTDAGLSDRVPVGLPIFPSEGAEPHLLPPLEVNRTPESDGGQVMYVMFTSGSTGRPKGVVVRHQSVVNLLCWATQELAIDAGDRVLQQTSIAFDVSVMEIFLPLVSGATLVIPESGGPTDAPTLISNLRTHRITHLFLVPSMLRVLLEGGGTKDCVYLKAVHSMGEHLPAPLRDEFFRHCSLPLYNWYGPTEATVFVTSHRFVAGGGPVFLGRPIANTRLAVLDSEQHPIPVGGIGELHLGGDSLAVGYFEQAGLTAEKFIPDPFTPNSPDRLYRTGDRVRRHPDGALEFLGRDDGQVKIRGNRVELGEIEATLERHPDVRAAVVVIQGQEEAEGRLIAYVEPRTGSAETPSNAGELMEGWKRIHDDTYRQSVPRDPRFNTAGWRSLLDRRQYTAGEMEEWVELAVGHVRTLSPRRVLDIGCGTGLLLHRLAPECQRYVGTELAPAALESLRPLTQDLPQVELWERAADDWSGIATGDFDTILLNSVIQYFPEADYLTQVLNRALNAVGDDGHVFMGDVRSLELLPAFHAQRLLPEAPDDLLVGQLRDQIVAACARERELICSPLFFQRLAAVRSRNPRCRVLLKEGTSETEMNLFRFDVILGPGLSPGSDTHPETVLRYPGTDGDRWLDACLGQARNSLLLTGIPDARLHRTIQGVQRIMEAPADLTCGDLRRWQTTLADDGLHPALIRARARDLGWQMNIECDPESGLGRMRLHLWREVPSTSPSPAEIQRRGDSGIAFTEIEASPLTNDPLTVRRQDRLMEDLRRWAPLHLPAAMLPSVYVPLRTLPRNDNGKLDRRRLPVPAAAGVTARFADPAPGTERQLAQMFADVLGIDRVGRWDDFFALGGHSLMALRLQNRIAAELRLHLSIADLFEHPTPARLATRLHPMPDSSSLILATTANARVAGEPFPASISQEALWRLDELYGADSLMNVAAAFRLRGPLDARLLDEAFCDVCRRHEVLRARFEERGGQLLQVIAPWPPYLERIRLRSGEPAELGPQVDQVIGRPFELKAGPLVRAVLMEISAGDHVLVVVMHHIVTDGWSMPVFFRELSELYNAMAQERPPRLEPITLHHADFAAWQRREMEAGHFEESLQHWRARLDGAEIVLDLPPDFERPRVVRQAGTIHRVTLDRSQVDPVRRLCEESDCTLFAALLSAFLVVLSRYTGRDDLVIGTPVAGRPQAELESLIGLFTNIVPLRADLSGLPDTHELLRRVRRYGVEALQHQGLPFSRLIEALALPRDTSRRPLVQVQFVLQNMPECVLALGEVRAELLPVSNHGAAFDLTLEITERSDGCLDAGFEYRTDLFAPETIHRLAGHFTTVLAGMCAQPASPVADLTMLSEAERRTLVIDWNQTAAPFPEHTTVSQWFGEQAARSPDACAVRFGNQELTYRELDRRSNFLAHRLRNLGLQPGESCGLCLHRSLHLAVAYLASLKAGAICVPLDPALPPRRMDDMLADAAVTTLLTEASLESRFAGRPVRGLSLDRFPWDQVSAPAHPPAATGSPDSVAILIYTSGSTGTPKGVQLLHRGILNCLTWTQREMPLGPSDRFLQTASIGFDASIAEIFWPLLHGATVVFARPDGHRDPGYIVEEIQRQRITRIMLTTSVLEAVLAVPGVADCTSLTAVISAGEALRPSVMKACQDLINAPLYNLYGPTETTVFATFWKCPRSGGAIRIGRPIANTQAYILDRRNHPAPVNVPGEVVLGGAGMSAGYRNLPARTADSFVTGLLPEATGTLYRTGDLARFRPDGLIEYLGRIDDQVKIRGVRIEPGEIEHVLKLHAGIRDAAVVAREAGPGDVRLVGFVIPAATPMDLGSLRAHLRAHLHPTFVPNDLVVVDALPRTSSGKLDRRALREGIRPAATTLPTVLPPTPASTNGPAIATIFSEVLGGRAVQLNEDFFELGGHSLLALQIINRINTRFGSRLMIAALFQNPTPAQLAILVDRPQA